MTYKVEHRLTFERFPVRLRMLQGQAELSCSQSGELLVRHPGKLIVGQRATFTRRAFVGDLSDDIDVRSHGNWIANDILLPLTVEIFTPDGLPFTSDTVTPGDLMR